MIVKLPGLEIAEHEPSVGAGQDARHRRIHAGAGDPRRSADVTRMVIPGPLMLTMTALTGFPVPRRRPGR